MANAPGASPAAAPPPPDRMRHRIPAPPRIAGSPESRAMPLPTGLPRDQSHHQALARGPPDPLDAAATPHRPANLSSSGSPAGHLLPRPRAVLLPWPPIRHQPSPTAPPNPLPCVAPRLAATPCICKLLQLAVATSSTRWLPYVSTTGEPL